MLKKYYLGEFFWAPIQVKWYQNTTGFTSGTLCDIRRYTCLPHCVTCCIPNEIDYGMINIETNSGTVASTRTTSLTQRH